MSVYWIRTSGREYYYRVEENGECCHCLLHRDNEWEYIHVYIEPGRVDNILNEAFRIGMGDETITEEYQVRKLNGILARNLL